MKDSLDAFIEEGMQCTYLQTDQGSEWKGDFPEFVQNVDIIYRVSKSHSP